VVFILRQKRAKNRNKNVPKVYSRGQRRLLEPRFIYYAQKWLDFMTYASDEGKEPAMQNSLKAVLCRRVDTSESPLQRLKHYKGQHFGSQL
jgi:hypothetical protein